MFREVSKIYGDVRRDSYYYNLKSFIQPDEPIVKGVARILSSSIDPIATAQDFVHHRTKYHIQKGEMWKLPTETLDAKIGDCDCTAILLCSILRSYLSPDEVFVAIGNVDHDGHAWVMTRDKLIESTHNSSKKVNENRYKVEVLFNDKYAFVDTSLPDKFGFLFVSGRYNMRVV